MAGVDRLAVDVVEGVARDRVARGPLERHQRAGDQPERGHDQQRVEQEHARGCDGVDDLLGGVDRGRAHSVLEFPGTYWPRLPKNHCERIWRATGAAPIAPKPPCSTVTTTRIGLTGSGT